MVNYYLLLITLVVFIIILIRLVIDFFSETMNQFFDKKIAARFLPLWLPFYSLQRLIKEVILKK
jgi:hypothetical protein